MAAASPPAAAAAAAAAGGADGDDGSGDTGGGIDDTSPVDTSRTSLDAIGTSSINRRSRHDELRNTACGSDELYGGTAVSKDIFTVDFVAEDGWRLFGWLEWCRDVMDRIARDGAAYLRRWHDSSLSLP